MTTLFIILSIVLLLCGIAILYCGVMLYKKDKYKPMLYISIAYSVYILIDLLFKIFRFVGVLK